MTAYDRCKRVLSQQSLTIFITFRLRIPNEFYVEEDDDEDGPILEDIKEVSEEEYEEKQDDT